MALATDPRVRLVQPGAEAPNPARYAGGILETLGSSSPLLAQERAGPEGPGSACGNAAKSGPSRRSGAAGPGGSPGKVTQPPYPAIRRFPAAIRRSSLERP